MRSRISLIAAALLAATAAAAHAPKVGHNGGPQTNAGRFHLEIVPQGRTVTVYLRDHADQAVPTEGFKGTASFTLEGASSRIPLAPAGDNKLTGVAGVPLPNQPKGSVEITPPTGGTAVGRF